MTEYEFFTVLRKRFGEREYALLPQVRNGTGFGVRTRTADALAVSLWPSRGIDVHGFEFKDSRADWLKELKQPEKSEEIGRYCAFWWIVVSDKEIVRKDELPKNWGLMFANGEIKTVTQAPRREALEPTWSFMAAVLRQAAEFQTNEKDILERIEKEKIKVRRECDEIDKRQRKSDNERNEKEQNRTLACIKEFEESSGIKIDTWRAENNRRIGEAVKLVLAGGAKGERERLQSIANQLEYSLASLRLALEE